jgi:hypothetical protein
MGAGLRLRHMCLEVMKEEQFLEPIRRLKTTMMLTQKKSMMMAKQVGEIASHSPGKQFV